MQIDDVTVFMAEIPLVTPYKVSRRVFHAFDPVVVHVRTKDGREGWGEAIATRGYSEEGPEELCDRCIAFAATLPGQDLNRAQASLDDRFSKWPAAASFFPSASDMALGHPLLQIEHETRVPLLEPVHEMEVDKIPGAIEGLLAQGFKTLKVKVGFDIDADLARVSAIQNALAGRGEIRPDANQGFAQTDGMRFASSLDPVGIQLFEQPCASDNWAANAAVAGVSNVPVMLDESIYGFDDIDRAAEVSGVGFVKLKLKKMGGLDLLRDGLDRIRSLGMRPVMGDGVATDICCWMEACVAQVTLDNAGEMNGFLKFKNQLLAEHLVFDNGDVVLPVGFQPRIDEGALARVAARKERFADTSVSVSK